MAATGACFFTVVALHRQHVFEFVSSFRRSCIQNKASMQTPAKLYQSFGSPLHIYIYYIYIERETERVIERERNRERENNACIICMYVHT